MNSQLEFECNNSRILKAADFTELHIEKFDVVINCIAMTNLEDCESNEDLAYWTNSEIPRILSELAKASGTKILHISTDAVFDGTGSFVSETDPPNPISIYGKSKLLGEEFVNQANQKNLICRVNFVGRSPKENSLFDFFYMNLKEKRKIHGYTNILFTPLYVADLVIALLDLIIKKKNGTYHLSSSSKISKFEFGQLVGLAFPNSDHLLWPTRYDKEVNGIARGLDLSMSNKKALGEGLILPDPTVGIIKLVESLG